MLTRESLYLLLEVERVRQNHARIRTTFVYPAGGLAFSCITFAAAGNVHYMVAKEEIRAAWGVTFQNCAFGAAFGGGSAGLCETLEAVAAFVERAPRSAAGPGCPLWEAGGGERDELFRLLKEAARRETRKTADDNPFN